MAREEFTDQEEILIRQTFTADWIHTFIKKPMLGGDLEGVQVAPPPLLHLPPISSEGRASGLTFRSRKYSL